MSAYSAIILCLNRIDPSFFNNVLHFFPTGTYDQVNFIRIYLWNQNNDGENLIH